MSPVMQFCTLMLLPFWTYQFKWTQVNKTILYSFFKAFLKDSSRKNENFIYTPLYRFKAISFTMLCGIKSEW